MSGNTIDSDLNRVVPGSGELDTIWHPGTPRVGKCGVILLHGQSNPQGWIDPGAPRYAMEMAATITACGIPCISAEMHGNAWANDVMMPDIPAAKTVLRNAYPSLRADKVIVFGISMGGAPAVRYAQQNPTAVAAVIGLIPAYDPLAVYNYGNIGDFYMEQAWGFSGVANFPAALNLAATSSLAAGIPILTGYSSNDDAVPAASVIAYHNAVGGTSENLINIGAVGHTFDTMPISTVVRFLVANGA